MAENNITVAEFDDGCTLTTALPVYQHSYGQILKIVGLDLPTAFQVHFSTDQSGGESVERIGTANQCYIPNNLLNAGTPLYAFIFLHDGENDGETVYKVVIPVFARPELPESEDPTPAEQSTIDGLIEALNTAVGLADGYADASATSAQASYEEAEKAEIYAKDSEAWAVGKRNGHDVDQLDPTFHNNAKYYAIVAEQGAAEGGFIQFYIDGEGHLIYEHTDNVDAFTFSLVNGHLIIEGD